MLTRRHLHIGLGVAWLLDAALQYQPYMFSAAFPRTEIAGAADGQPALIGTGVHWAAHLMAAAPVAINAVFATVQLLLGIGLLCRRTIRPALVGSVLWALSIWYFGEALGGIASGKATLIAGAPGAALLYALVAALAWPADDHGRAGTRASSRWGTNEWTSSRWTAIVPWALVWCGGALLQVLPAQRDSWWLPVPLAAVLFLVGVAPVAGLQAARIGALVGAVLGLTFWIFGQSFGELWTGQATDPNTGPLLVLLALAVVVRTANGPAVSQVYPAERPQEQPETSGPVRLRADPSGRETRTQVA